MSKYSRMKMYKIHRFLLVNSFEHIIEVPIKWHTSVKRTFSRLKSSHPMLHCLGQHIWMMHFPFFSFQIRHTSFYKCWYLSAMSSPILKHCNLFRYRNKCCPYEDFALLSSYVVDLQVNPIAAVATKFHFISIWFGGMAWMAMWAWAAVQSSKW